MIERKSSGGLFVSLFLTIFLCIILGISNRDKVKTKPNKWFPTRIYAIMPDMDVNDKLKPIKTKGSKYF